jgi:hypothetical protein
MKQYNLPQQAAITARQKEQRAQERFEQEQSSIVFASVRRAHAERGPQLSSPIPEGEIEELRPVD